VEQQMCATRTIGLVGVGENSRLSRTTEFFHHIGSDEAQNRVVTFGVYDLIDPGHSPGVGVHLGRSALFQTVEVTDGLIVGR
jgi:hypothetical protein